MSVSIIAILFSASASAASDNNPFRTGAGPCPWSLLTNELREYVRLLPRQRLLTETDLRTLVKRYRLASTTAEKHRLARMIILDLRGQTAHLVLRWWRPSLRIGLLDLIQEAEIGIIDAINKYDPAKGDFGAYVWAWVRARTVNAIFQDIRDYTGLGMKPLVKNYFYRRIEVKKLMKDPKPPSTLEEAYNQVIVARERPKWNGSKKELIEDLKRRKIWAKPDSLISIEDAYDQYFSSRSLDRQVGEGGGTLRDSLSEDQLDPSMAQSWNQETGVVEQDQLEKISYRLKEFRETLKPRDKELWDKLIFPKPEAEDVDTDQSVAQSQGVSRQAIQSRKETIKKSLRAFLMKHLDPDLLEDFIPKPGA